MISPDTWAALLKSYGPGLAPWLLLFAFVAFAAGKGGKLALGNVRQLMEAQEDLRKRTLASLHDCEAQIRRRDATILALEEELELEAAALKLLRRERDALEDVVTDLRRDLEACRAKKDPPRGGFH
jgi:hypothetical protein